MDSKNRILRLMREKDDQTKIDLLTEYHGRLMDDAPLHDEELDELLRILCAKQESITILMMLWKIALESKFHPKVEQYSMDILEKGATIFKGFPLFRSWWHQLKYYKRYRRCALSYLRIHNSPYFAQNFEKFLQERDPYILYEVACEIGKSSVSQKITMLIQFYHRIETHDLYEIVTAEILAAGTVEHLAMIQGKMKTNRRTRIYRELAEYLEAELTKRS